MPNNIIDMLGFKDRDIKAKITTSTPYSMEVTVEKCCKIHYCPLCGHRMYSKGPYTRTLNHPILQDGRSVSIKLKQRRFKCTNPVCGHFETEQFSSTLSVAISRPNSSVSLSVTNTIRI